MFASVAAKWPAMGESTQKIIFVFCSYSNQSSLSSSGLPKRPPMQPRQETSAQHDELIRYIHEAWHKVGDWCFHSGALLKQRSTVFRSQNRVHTARDPFSTKVSPVWLASSHSIWKVGGNLLIIQHHLHPNRVNSNR